MKKRYFIFFICFIIFAVIIFSSVAIFSNTNKDNTKDKIEEEISYIETKVLGMLNSLNNIPFSNSVLLEKNTIKTQSQNNEESSERTQSSEGNNSSNKSSSSGGDSSSSSNNEGHTQYSVSTENILIGLDKEIDWDYIKNTVEALYTTWPTIMIDLHSINIKNDDILSFSNNLDTLIVNIENEDKRAIANSLAMLYSYIPIYVTQFSENSNKINNSYTKSYIINSYVLLEDSKWDDMQSQISKAQEYFGLIINSVNEERNQSNVSKSYVLLNEMNNAIKIKDKKLYYLKYKNLMESLMSI